MNQKTFLVLALSLSLFTASARGNKYTLHASAVEFQILTDEADNLRFNVSYKGTPVVRDSPLGFNMDHVSLGENTSIKSVREINSGEATYTVRHDNGMTCDIDVRTYPDGIALRYRFPTETPRCIYAESTAFTFPAATKAWYASGPFQYGWIQAYQERTMDTIAGQLLAPPATFLLPGGIYAAITEANLFNFHGAVLFGVKPGQVKFGYVENLGHIRTGTITGLPPAKYYHEAVRDIPWIVSPPQGKSEITTPWRILMLADDLNGLVNNQIISAVSDRPDKTLFPGGGKQDDWIKPGRSVFTWLAEGGASRLSPETYRTYIRGAAELGLESVVVDDGWEHWTATGRDKWDILDELVRYGRERNVDLWVWRSSSPRPRPRYDDIGLIDPDERTAFMKKCAQTGVKGLKIDFLHTENVFTVNLMEDILKDAAREKLMVIFHGVNKPTGDSFTYPNLLAKEAVRGLEGAGSESTSAPGPPWPYHNTVLPFTRWLAGGADYTPLNFRRACPPSVTFAHQLASIYVLTSPMLIFSADMEDMLESPGRPFIEDVAVVWDETVVLPESRIGELAAIARRKGDTWYVGVLNGEKARSFETELTFLPRGTYEIVTAADSLPDRKHIILKRGKIRSTQKLREELLPGGGFVAKINKNNR
ncbi:MAG: glycoside hydrolase family 97 protein [Tannerella sp.]|jgi:alpha-glucosidase|nr:glycoside hydrolase family 97 protein [Tannerella sp.]